MTAVLHKHEIAHEKNVFCLRIFDAEMWSNSYNIILIYSSVSKKKKKKK